MAFQMEAWLHGRMLCCVLCLHHRGGWRLPSEHRDCCIEKAYHLYILWLVFREKCSSDFWEKRISSVEDIFGLFVGWFLGWFGLAGAGLL